ncbi:TetR/AcrR family transcriptional regulator [Neobacillus muris]|uniref:TetR/AcrR family transcriptional regulator n=1 Tax=Neobacillus muris TaxID=2941334 RepID=UPI00203AEC55|nr:TetR/AcrR family transcriptional regulator C-terminal domain-containing protein [Neobacillus muris]
MTYTTERTRRQIIQSFMHVLQTKRFSSITVQDICDDALIHRTTFYRYYEDKYSLLRDFIYHLSEELIKLNKTSNTDAFRLLVDYVEENIVLFENTLLGSDGHIFFKSMVKIASDILREHSITENDPVSNKINQSKYPDVMCELYATSIMTILQNWISKEYNYQKDELFEIFNQVMFG